MPDTESKLTALQEENVRALIVRLRKNPDRMINFAEWVVAEMWDSIIDQSNVITLDMGETMRRSGFVQDFLDRHPEDIADIKRARDKILNRK
ncbi:hypothetical protein [Agrobacterium tumefaciens]|uniref:hypothetical protein n=1 Tax=Agrobacterium tumefaciens TaxID=358 RepID=UPI0015734CF1|nr:hypothetical protein [Agrobacterium tumefaciens]NTD84338.1 hypothetical protein [Agrobacterium tumefaciens]NTD94654.1 hypothetical protein [Agrobacterium tumefaciens]NTD96105.1 hypothetical protein [Agrobacterium tumefaciens]NTE13964.1 hypothetical protein [Agrobacterium tumefaciens]NTE19578.1 hypothetical protein [Agrobacterium tumefaciens]